ncbi:MAG: ABC transporter ATP-binding protein [Thermoplasmatales archaeon]
MKIKTISLSKTYEGKYKALESVSINVNLNGIFSIIGRNGAGKTTFLRILSTQLLPTAGRAYLNDYDVVAEADKVRREIAVVPQEARALPWLTPIQTVTSYLMWRGYSYRNAKERAKEALRSLGLEEQENIKSRKLSGGQKRKLMVATVISSEAGIIFLDEPTTGLDYISRKELWEILERLKSERLIILTTHYLEEAEVLGDLIMILDKGKLIDIGRIDDLRSKIKLPYVLKVYAKDFSVKDSDIEIHKISENETFIYGTASKIYDMIPTLVSGGIRFTVEQASLSNIFEQYLRDEEDGKGEKEGW